MFWGAVPRLTIYNRLHFRCRTCRCFVSSTPTNDLLSNFNRRLSPPSAPCVTWRFCCQDKFFDRKCQSRTTPPQWTIMASTLWNKQLPLKTGHPKMKEDERSLSTIKMGLWGWDPTQLCGDYSKPLWVNNQNSMKRKSLFFHGLSTSQGLTRQVYGIWIVY